MVELVGHARWSVISYKTNRYGYRASLGLLDVLTSSRQAVRRRAIQFRRYISGHCMDGDVFVLPKRRGLNRWSRPMRPDAQGSSNYPPNPGP